MVKISEAAVRAFEGRTAVITGGGTGVGAAVALALAKAGASIHLVGRRLEALHSIATRASSSGSEVACYAVDLTSNSGQIQLTQRLLRDLSHVDILIQNAAAFVRGAIEDASLADFDIQYQTNVRAPYALTQALLPMLKARRGQVVFINSSSGISAKPFSAQYDSTKHAFKAIMNSLRTEVNEQGARVPSVYLGHTANDMHKHPTTSLR